MAERTDEQIELITEELDDLARQVDDGELDAATADRLRAKYVSELDALMLERSLEPAIDEAKAADRVSRVSGRALVGTAIVAVSVAVIAVFAVNSLTGPSTAGVEGVASDVVTGDAGIDLSQVSDAEMEAVVAQNPDVVGMRLALARRYFEAGDFDKALNHYMVTLDIEKHPEALANVGWMTYLSGRPDVALEYVEASLQRQPSSLTATWFLGNIEFSLGNFEAASEALSKIISADSVPDDVREAAETLLSQMENR